MAVFNPLPTEKLLARLKAPKAPIDMVLDTDTYNEVDDQFALMYSLLSAGQVHLEAVYAAPFHNNRSDSPGDGMRKSYAEIVRLLGTVDVPAEGFVFEGSSSYLPSGDTTVDSPAARVALDCGVPLVLVPCMGVASHMTVSFYEMQACIGGKNALCDALLKLFSEYSKDYFGWVKELWDVAAVSWLIHPEWLGSTIEPSPILTDNCCWKRDDSRHPIRVICMLDRCRIFRDMYTKLIQGKK